MRYQRVTENGAPSSNSRNPRSNPPAPPERASFELELSEPPIPQPHPGLALDDSGVVRAVRISLTGRSRHANLVGSSVRANELPDENGFVRQTLSTRVATRNLLSRAELRSIQLQSQADNP
jgi:hypothetical protein